MPTSRNAPCSCGSGRKFKKCCGRAQARDEHAALTDGSYFRFRVSLLDIQPTIWRSFLLRSSATFQDLHDAVQALGWSDAHLWNFVDPKSSEVIAGAQVSEPLLGSDPDPRSVRLAEHFRKTGQRCHYMYDFGDSWLHEILLEGIEERDEQFDRVLLGGAGAFPPEDCGGLPGFMRLCEFVAVGKDPWGEDEVLRSHYGELDLSHFDLEGDRERFNMMLGNEAPSAPAPMLARPPTDRVRRIDRQTMDEIAGVMQKAIGELSQRLGLKIILRRATYSEINAKLEFEAATQRDDGIVMNKDAEEFENRCREFGLELEDLGRAFHCDGDDYRIVGLRPRAKQPVLCEQLAAPKPTHVRMSAALVRECLSLAAPASRSLRLLKPDQP